MRSTRAAVPTGSDRIPPQWRLRSDLVIQFAGCTRYCSSKAWSRHTFSSQIPRFTSAMPLLDKVGFCLKTKQKRGGTPFVEPGVQWIPSRKNYQRRRESELAGVRSCNRVQLILFVLQYNITCVASSWDKFTKHSSLAYQCASSFSPCMRHALRLMTVSLLVTFARKSQKELLTVCLQLLSSLVLSRGIV